MSDKHQNILILGNGFDLNLKLKTGYCDFIRSTYFLALKEEGSQLALHLTNQHELNNWIDIENELKEYSLHEFGNLEEEYEDLCIALMNYLDTIEYPKNNWPITQAFELFENFAKAETLVIDFNYTPTSRMLLQHFGRTDEEIDKMVIKIHGSTQNRDIIFGVEDSARIKSDHIFLKKSFNLNFQPMNFKDLLNDASTVTIFGHSLGVTDYMYFKNFFNNAAIGITKPKMMLFYHGKAGYKQLMIQLDDMTNNSLSSLKQLNKIKFVDSAKQESMAINASKT